MQYPIWKGERHMLKDLISNKEYYINIIKNEWQNTSILFPDFLSETSIENQTENELYIQEVINDLHKQLKSYTRIPIMHRQWKKKTLAKFNDILNREDILCVHNSMDTQALDTFQDEIKTFLRHVRKFAPELSFNDIGQALRNYIVYAMFKGIHQDQSAFNQAGFGYSMLYPFTDNYIDSRNCSDLEKKEYNRMIRDKLNGKMIHPANEYQLKTSELLQFIEKEYPRDKDNTVFQLLLMMLDAQENSIRQQHNSMNLSTEERMDISIYKGGISVLMDRFFVHKDITEEDLLFYLKFGFFLQLADDLQDIKEDSIHGNKTLFTIDLSFENEENLVNKMLHYVHQIFETFHVENIIFKNFILRNCYLLIYTSVTGSKEFFSNDYLGSIERYLPVSFNFLDHLLSNRLENQNINVQDHYMMLLDELLV